MLVGEMAGADGVFAKILSVGGEHYEPEMFMAKFWPFFKILGIFFSMFEALSSQKNSYSSEKCYSAPLG